MNYVLTVGHKRFDSRIWLKEVTTLVEAGYPLHYLVCDGEGDQHTNSVKIRDFGKIHQRSGFRHRIRRMFNIVRDGGLKRGDIVHFHDGVFFHWHFCSGLKAVKLSMMCMKTIPGRY